jgi:hypothetical protein
VTVTAEPSTLPPGGTAQLAAAFRNVNGLSATGRVDFTLSGVDAEPEGSPWLPRVEPTETADANDAAEAKDSGETAD